MSFSARFFPMPLTVLSAATSLPWMLRTARSGPRVERIASASRGPSPVAESSR